MASEYLKWKYRDVEADKPPSYTRKERIANWFYYYKWRLAAWAVLLCVAGSILWDALGIGRAEPDHLFAYIGSNELPEDCAAALETALASLGEDVNGDGRVTVQLRQYAIDRGGDPETAMYYNYAADVTLAADLTAAESYFFLVEDADAVQEAYQLFARADGTPPEEGDVSAADKVFRWADCPVLSGLAVEQELLQDLSIGRRCFFDAGQAEGREADAALWDVITKGVDRK